MTENQKNQIDECRENGMTISETADATGLPLGTVKSYCRRRESEQPDTVCKYCGAPLTHTEGHKEKHFCNQSCYFRWRYAQGDLKRTEYKKKCAYCGKTFTIVSKKKQKYCSRACFLKSRGGDRSG